MFGSNSAFGQTSGNPFGSQSGFGQAQTNNPLNPKPFGSTNPFGSQSGSLFGSTSTGVFGASQPSSPLSSAPAFGASSSPAFVASTTPTFGSSSASFGGSSVFGQKPSFGGFGTPTQSSPFGSTFGQSQPSFGSNAFASSTPFGASSQPAFGANTGLSFGSSSTPAFGATSSSAFGATSTPAFGSTPTSTFGSTGNAFGVSTAPVFGSGGGFGSSNTSVFGSPSAPAFGASTTPTFGATTTTPGFGSSSPAFGSSTTSAFGSSSSPFGSTSPPSFNFGSAQAFGQSAAAFGSSPFGTTAAPFGTQSSPFGSQTSTTFTGSSFGQPTLGGQRGGSRIASYTSTPEADTGSGTQPGKLESISAMPVFKDKSHEELRWEDYQQGDKGGPNPAGMPSSGTGFGVSAPQSSPFASSSTFGQSASNPFSSSTPANPFAPKPSSTFGSTGFGTPSTSAFGSSAFGTSTSSNPFGQASTPSTSLFASSSGAAFNSNTTSIFGSTSTSVFGSSPSLFGSNPTQGAAPSSFASGLSFINTQSSPFQTTTPSLGQSSSGFGQSSLTAGANSSSPFGQSGFMGSTPSLGGGLFPSSSSFTSSGLGFGQTPSFSMPSQPAQSTPTNSTFSFGNFGQTQTAGLSAFGLGSSAFGQSVGQPSTTQSPATMQQPVAVTNPFGVLPAMPQMSIGGAGGSSSFQYGISSMPAVDKPVPVRISSLLTTRHLSQRRIKLPARKYHPKNDKVPFYSDDEKTPSTPKADALFIPRENPRALIIRPMDHWSSKSSPSMDTTSLLHENGNVFRGENGHISNGSLKVANKEKTSSEHDLSAAKEKSGHAPDHPNGLHNSHDDDKQDQKGDSCITLTGHRAGEAAIVYEHGADIEAMMPKLRHSDYYTEPRIQELAAKERAEPGFCRRVRDFVVGRHGYGSIKFLGETDVRRLDLESLIQFNNREVIVYMDDTKKPPVGQGLNKPAEVTLLNIKCYNKKTGQQYTDGPKVEKYTEMLKRKAEDQGAEFVSYDPVRGEWKFRVSHFSRYKLEDEELESHEDEFSACIVLAYGRNMS